MTEEEFINNATKMLQEDFNMKFMFNGLDRSFQLWNC